MKKFVLALLLCILLIGCKTTQQYVPVEHTRVEYMNTIHIDTCFVKDSIYIKEKNDTVYLEKYKHIYKNRVFRDTIMINDTIPIIKTIETTKEVNIVRNWQIALMVLGGVFIVFLLFKIKKALGI